MTGTLTPFLYHTRTLYRHARVVWPVPTYFTRSLHTTRCQRSRYPEFQRTKDPIPFELPPDLEKHNPDPDEDDNSMEDYLGKVTITPRERQAFEGIFKEIADQGKRPVPPTSRTPKKPEAPTFLQALQQGLKQEPQDVKLNINTIMEDAAMTYSKTETGIRGMDSLSPLEQTYSAAEREKVLLRFPPSLRQAARWAFGTIDVAEEIVVQTEGGKKEQLGFKGGKRVPGDAVEAVQSKEKLPRTVELEALRRTERMRIKSQMDGARTDFELWDVLEKEVFPLVERLGIAEDASEKPLTPKSKKLKRGKNATETETEDESAEPALSMEVYGPIYPMLLLDGLNLLDTGFSRPSSLVFSLLPRVKQLGLASYVLGVSTSFYNRMMAVLWDRYGDAVAVISLLEEMRHAGLYFDENSRAIVQRIQYVFQTADAGDRGHFAQLLMSTPEFEPILTMNLKHWRSQINRSIQERAVDLA